MDFAQLNNHIIDIALAAIAATFITSIALLCKSLLHFTRTGPQVKEEILKHYLSYSAYAMALLFTWSVLISGYMALTGAIIYYCAAIQFNLEFSWTWAVASSFASIIFLTSLQFCRHLLYIPSSISASWQYRYDRLYPLWNILSPRRLRITQAVIFLSIAALCTSSILKLYSHDLALYANYLIAFISAIVFIFIASAWRPEPAPRKSAAGKNNILPNIIMIGSDTLRADRLGVEGYRRKLTPAMDKLIKNGNYFSNCYVPLARTAPSLLSLLSGTWPHTHAIRDNYVPDHQTELKVETLPELLKHAGYESAAVSDWSGADLKKLKFGFDQVDAPDDQWNMKYYLRQGPMDLRLFLSLFTHNRLGKTFLPQIYYLASVPLSSDLGKISRHEINRLSAQDKPFFLNTFMSTTHVPFGSEYPYYLLFSNPDYDGESKFVMTSLRDPNEIIQQQEKVSDQFDLDQIMNLYDGCVKRFDDEIGRICDHIEKCGLSENTIIIVYSDHGTDFFENDTWGQGNTVNGADPSARVPLIIMDPRMRGTGIIDKTVRNIDLTPTLLDILNIPLPDTLDGKSLKPYMDGSQTDLELPAFQETGIWLGKIKGIHPEHISYPDILELIEVPIKETGTLAIKKEYEEIIIRAKDRMIRTNDWKLTYQPLNKGALYKLYDLAKDPQCTIDVSESYPEICSQLKARLIEWMLQDKSYVWKDDHLVCRE